MLVCDCCKTFDLGFPIKHSQYRVL